MKGKWSFALLALVALLAVGCGSKPAESPAPAAAAAPVINSTGTKYAVDTEHSSAAYSVGETFLGQDRKVTAVGKTSVLKGEIVINEGVIQPSVVQVDLSTLKSDESRRDNRVRSALDTAKHPMATFTISGAEGNPVLKDGQETALKLQGTMNIKGTAKPLAFDAKATLSGDTLTLTAVTTFKMTEFKVDPPNIANFVAVKDDVQLDVTFVGKR